MMVGSGEAAPNHHPFGFFTEKRDAIRYSLRDKKTYNYGTGERPVLHPSWGESWARYQGYLNQLGGGEAGMRRDKPSSPIRVAVAGVGNCAGSMIEGLAYYREHPETDQGLLFPVLAGASVRDIQIVAAFDISVRKVGQPLSTAIYQPPNNFVRIGGVRVPDDRPRLSRAYARRQPGAPGPVRNRIRSCARRRGFDPAGKPGGGSRKPAPDGKYPGLGVLRPHGPGGRLRLYQLHPGGHCRSRPNFSRRLPGAASRCSETISRASWGRRSCTGPCFRCSPCAGRA